MENKKSLKANLEKTKSIFLMIGLITAISLLVFAFSWESVQEYVAVTTDEPYIEEEKIQITKPEDEKTEEKVEKPTPQKVFADILIMVDDTTTVKDIVFWTPEDTLILDDPIIEDTGGEPLIYAAVMPRFPGGKKALQIFVANHVVYPAIARENGIQGTVHLRFEVTKTGTIGRIEILNKTVDKLLQDASVDVIKTLPKFKPGMQNGEKVSVWFSIPISFKLN